MTFKQFSLVCCGLATGICIHQAFVQHDGWFAAVAVLVGISLIITIAGKDA